MSEVAGRMSIQAGAHCLENRPGGRGMLLGGVPGVPAAKVVILGGGVVGTNAARMAMGLEAHVTILDVALARLYELDLTSSARMLNTIFSTDRCDRRACRGGRSRHRRRFGARRRGAQADHREHDARR